MGAYQYQALKKNGHTCSGFLEADSARHARQLLRDRGLIPTQVQLLTPQSEATKAQSKISATDRALITRQLATLVAAGIPVEESLLGVSEQMGTSKIRELILGIRAKVLEGYSLAQAMDCYPQAFPELYRATVNSGEQTGHLDLVLEKLAEYTEKQQQTKEKIQQALLYPLTMIMISIAIITFLLSFVVPKIIEVFSDNRQVLPTMTKLLIHLSHFVKKDGLYTLVALFLAFIMFKKSLANLKVKKIWHSFLLKLPIISYLVTTINVARYIHTFSILFAAGLNILETMRVSASLISNVMMKKAFEAAAVRVREGCGINQALKETGYVSPMSIHLIASGEKSSQLSAMMERTANYLDNEVKRWIDTLLTLLEPVIILLMGILVLFIVLATLLPIFSMEQSLN